MALAGLIIGNFPQPLPQGHPCRRSELHPGHRPCGSIPGHRPEQLRQRLRQPAERGWNSLHLSRLGHPDIPVDAGDRYLRCRGYHRSQLAGAYLHLFSASRITDNITSAIVGATATSNNIVDGVKLSGIVTATADTLFNNSTGVFDKYILLGVGARSTLVGADRSLLEAPTRSSAVSGNDPKSTYQRYGVVFGLRGAAASRQAVFIGVVGLDSTGLSRSERRDQGLQRQLRPADLWRRPCPPGPRSRCKNDEGAAGVADSGGAFRFVEPG